VSNRLADSSSLYLRQHGVNPVNWYPWGEEALIRAASETKLIFLSIGYSSCHWCHVMEQESFEDATTAAFLNTHFIAIKVDREERPDLDSLYMEAVQLMSGQGGWPLNVWLTPELKPVYGGTYFPPEPRHNRPSFVMVLQRLVELWTQDAPTLLRRAESITASLNEDLFAHLPPSPVAPDLLGDVFAKNATRFDATSGGFGAAPKFPMAMWLRFLWRYAYLEPGSQAHHMVVHSVLSMCRGGIYDAIGGGFHRYSTDDRWLVPHFEKMLYDQAQLLQLMSEVWVATKHPLIKACIDQTGDFLDREMRLPEGGYGSSLDADNAGSEGGFYTWTYAELMGLAPELTQTFDIQPQGNWEHRIILERRTDHILPESTLRMLREERERREERPAFDPKRLTSWNAMTLSAFCSLHQATGEPIWRERAMDLAATLRQSVVRDDHVLHQVNGNTGFSQDYGTLCEAFCRVYELTADSSWLHLAEWVAQVMMTRFLDVDTASFYFSEPSKDLLFRKKELFDHAEPSGNSAALAGLYRLYRHTLNPQLLALVERGLAALTSITPDHGLSLGVALQLMAETVAPRTEWVLSADDGALLAVNRSSPDPFRMIVQGPTPDKPAINGLPTAWLCTQFSCRAPVHTPDDLLDALANHEK
jgi:uncharacterized protein YyaL (SSP411 family)